MLYLSRKIGESIVINNSIELQIIEVRGKAVKLGFSFPPDSTVLRKEIHDKIMAENMAAAVGARSEADLLDANLDFDLNNLPTNDTP
jgi:carbon storage regulator